MKFKKDMNKTYTIIAVYVIVTCIIIYCLTLLANNVPTVLAFILSKVKLVLGILKPVVIAFAFAYILHPLVMVLEKCFSKIKYFKKKPSRARTTAVFTSVIMVLCLIGFIVSMFVYSVTKQLKLADIDDLINIGNQYLNSFNELYMSLQTKINGIDIQSPEIKQYVTDSAEYLLGFVQGFANNTMNSITNFSSSVTTFIFALVICIYMLIDYKVMTGYLSRVCEAVLNKKANRFLRKMVEDFDYCFSGYIKGQLLDAAFMSVAISIVLSVIGIKFAILIGICAGIGNLIPYCGPIIAYIGTILFALVNGQFNLLIWALIALFIIQAIDGNVVGPKLLGMSVQIHPILIILSLIIGSAIGGLLGMLLAVPCGALVKIWFGRYVDKLLKQKAHSSSHEDENADVAD